MRHTSHRSLVLSVVALATLGAAAVPAGATNSWGSFHWARTSNPFVLKLGDNLSPVWDPHLAITSSDWSQSTVLDTTVVPGGTAPKVCRPTTGRLEVCSAAYGKVGWLGVAQVWLSGAHITKGTVKLNDTYFGSPPYNTPAWRNLVSCQEVGHGLGLDHQDEGFDNANLGTCMDYTNDPSTNQHPNQHDYDQLVSIYAHVDSTTTLASSTASGPSAAAGGNTAAEWGSAIRYSSDGRPSRFERDLGAGERLFTFVIWAGAAERPGPAH